MADITVVKRVIENLEVAFKLIDGPNLASQVARERLEDSLRLLEKLVAPTIPGASTLELPITVWFRSTKADKWIQGKLYKDITLEFNGTKYSSPSNAATALARNSRDGWRDIYYDDPKTSQRLRIHNLRQQGVFGERAKKVIKSF